MVGNVPHRQNPVIQRRSAAATTEAGDALSELVVDVFRLSGMLNSAGDALAQPAGQTSARWRVLAAVEHTPLTVAQIARAWNLARQSVQRVADLLASEGLVTYERNPAHRRASLVQLTPTGCAALRRIQTLQRTWADDVGQQVGAARLKTASQTLLRVMEALDNHARQRETATPARQSRDRP